MRSRLRLPSLLALGAILLVFPPAAAQRQAGYDDDIRQSVARVSYFEGEVSFNSGDAPDDWQPASVNYPMTFGDRIWADRSARVEIQLQGGRVFLGPETELAALELTRDARQFSLALGTASFRIDRLDRNDIFEVATPNLSVTFEAPGIYRIDVDEDGDSRVTVQQGQATAAAAGGQVPLGRGEQMRVRGLERPDYDVVGLSRPDSWDRWVDQRARRYRSVRSASYVHPDIYGVADLDAYGSWENAHEYGSVWYPRGVSAGWEPYRAGRWIWRDPWGWTWLSSEPWGWAPYHYGRWAVVRGRWGWVPVGPGGHAPGYSPALVGFVGGGAGWSLSVSAGGFVGWFPLGPREPFDPWWYHARSTANVTGFNYAYRSRATVVSRDTFVRGGRVDRDIVRDARVVSQVSAAPVLRGPIPVLPTRESIRVAPVGVEVRGRARPPEQVIQREVVTRTAPPPAPPTFDRKLEVIREKGGEPVPVDVARRLSADQGRGDKGTRAVRPAAREEVQLAPRGEVKDSRKPQPLPPSATSPPASTGRPAPDRNVPPPPVQERAPATDPETRREPIPARPAPEARPAPRDAQKSPKNDVEPAAPPPKAERPAARPMRVPGRPPVPTPTLDREVPPPPPQARPQEPQVRPDQPKPGKPEPDKVQQRRGEPGQPVPTPTPKPKKEKKGHPDKEPEPEKKEG